MAHARAQEQLNLTVYFRCRKNNHKNSNNSTKQKGVCVVSLANRKKNVNKIERRAEKKKFAARNEDKRIFFMARKRSRRFEQVLQWPFHKVKGKEKSHSSVK